MTQAMTKFNGIGLAAPQLGINARFFVVLTRQGPKMFINPGINMQGDTVESTEGCLSIPGYYDVVPRAEKVIILYTDIDGNTQEETYEGQDALTIQHEYDHIKGVLFIDLLPKHRQLRAKKKVEIWKRRNGFKHKVNYPLDLPQ